MAYKFESLQVWQLSLDYADTMYEIADKLPPLEDFNLKIQIRKASTSISLNIAEGQLARQTPSRQDFLEWRFGR